ALGSNRSNFAMCLSARFLGESSTRRYPNHRSTSLERDFGVEDSPMLFQREPVCHAGDIIAHNPCGRGIPRLSTGSLPVLRQKARIVTEGREQLAHHALGRGHGSHDARVPVHARKQKILERTKLGKHAIRKGSEGVPPCPHVGGRCWLRDSKAASCFRENVV